MAIVEKIEVKGRENPIAVEFSTSTKEFQATVDGDKLADRDYQKLRDKVLAALKKQKLNISVCYYQPRDTWNHSGPKWVDGVATGVHSGNGNLLVSWGAGRVEQLHSYGVALPKGDVDRVEYERLVKQKEDSEKALREFKESNAPKVPGWGRS